MRAFLFCALVCGASAFVGSTSATPGTPEEMMMQQMMEQNMASSYLDIVLKLQHAQMTMQGAQFFLQEAHALATPVADFEEDSDNSDSDDVDLEEDEFVGQQTVTQQYKPCELRLQGAFHILYANQIRSYQILIHAPDVQRDYYYNRLLQLMIQGMGGEVPSQIYQVLYMSSYNSQLKTLKLAYALQSVSHLRMWMEDEMDVNSAVVEGGVYASSVAAEQEVPLATDRSFFFHAYQTLMTIDFQSFMLDMYVSQSYGALFGTGQAAFIEEEAVTGAEAKFTGADQGGYMMQYLFYMKWYQIMLEMSSASSGAQGSQLEMMAVTNQATTDVSKHVAMSYQTSWSSLMSASQIDYMLTIFSMYQMYAPMMGAATAAPQAQEPAPAAQEPQADTGTSSTTPEEGATK